MVLERLSPEHLSGAADLYVRVFNGPPWKDGWSIEGAHDRLGRMSSHPGFFGVVAIEGDCVTGFACGYSERWVRGDHFHLKEMCVAPERQHQGIGSAILENLVACLGKKAVEAIYLETQVAGPAAAFYNKHGFRALRLQSMTRTLDGSA